MKSGKTKYTDNRGILELRRKISQYVNNRYLANYNENNVIVTNGGKQAISMLYFLSSILVMKLSSLILLG